jgi:sialidase-1
VVMKRSDDGGTTWSPLRVVNAGDGNTHGNPVPIVDRTTGRILLATTYNTATPDGLSCMTPCNRTPHIQYSDDDGATWSTPRDITSAVREPEWNSWYATGPGHGIQLTTGPHAGRLVFGINAESYADGHGTANYAALVYSDDHGSTWHIGATDRWDVSATDGTYRQKPQELSLVQLGNGSVYAAGRETDGTDLGARTFAVSKDGGESFTAPFTALPDLYAPGVQGSVLALPDRLLFASPADPDRRRTMMVRCSFDDGRTWESVDQGSTVTTDWSGYSDMAGITQDRTGLLYESGGSTATDEIRFARFTTGWLGGRPEPYPRTPDLAPGAPGADVLGGAHLSDGRFGHGISFDGTDAAVRLPYRDSLLLGTGDFTVSLWVRYSAAAGAQPLLSMGGMGTDQPQVTLAADPAAGTITGSMTAQDGPPPVRTASVGVDGSFDDGQWHFVSLRRSDGTLTLTVDERSATADDVPGSVSTTSPFGVHLGQTVDSRTFFTGSLDEVRVYDRALTDAELDLVRTRNLPAAGSVVLHLPMDSIK